MQKSALKAIITGLLKESEERQKSKDHLRPYIVLIEVSSVGQPIVHSSFLCTMYIASHFTANQEIAQQTKWRSGSDQLHVLPMILCNI